MSIEIPVDIAAWIRCFHPSPGSKMRLVCFPHAGGSASFYYPISAALRPDVEVLTVQYPGRQDRRMEAPVSDIKSLAKLIFNALRPRLADRPHFFGHSMGAVVAFEVTRLMEQELGLAPKRLIASGRRAPSRRRDESIHLQDDKAVVADLKRLSGTNVGMLEDPEVLRMILPAIRSDYRAIETYVGQPGAMISCPITVIVGDSDPQVTLDEARAWREHSSAGFDMYVRSGGHFYLTAQPAETISLIADVMDGDYPSR